MSNSRLNRQSETAIRCGIATIRIEGIGIAASDDSQAPADLHLLLYYFAWAGIDQWEQRPKSVLTAYQGAKSGTVLSTTGVAR